MQFAPINWLAIGGALVATFMIGGLWYSPLLFVNSWLRTSGVNKQVFDAGLRKALVGDLFSAFATALVLNQVIRWSGITGVISGLIVAFLVWIGRLLGARRQVGIFHAVSEHVAGARESGRHLVHAHLLALVLRIGTSALVLLPGHAALNSRPR